MNTASGEKLWIYDLQVLAEELIYEASVSQRTREHTDASVIIEEIMPTGATKIRKYIIYSSSNREIVNVQKTHQKRHNFRSRGLHKKAVGSNSKCTSKYLTLLFSNSKSKEAMLPHRRNHPCHLNMHWGSIAVVTWSYSVTFNEILDRGHKRGKRKFWTNYEMEIRRVSTVTVLTRVSDHHW